MRADLGRLVRFNEQRSVEPAQVGAYVEQLRAAAGPEGRLEIDNPRQDEQRIRLAVAERAGACAIEPAPGGRLAITLGGSLDLARAGAACRVARDRGWRAYRAVEAYSSSPNCRRRMLLDHFGDSTPGAPEGRCCDVCDPDGWLPDPEQLVVRKRPRKGAAPGSRPPSAPSSLPPTSSCSRRSRSGAAKPLPASPLTRWPTTRRWRRSPPRGPPASRAWPRFTASARPSSSATQTMCCG